MSANTAGRDRVGGTASGPMRCRILVGLMLLVATMAGCGGAGNSGSKGNPASGSNLFEQFDQQVRGLVSRRAQWQAPEQLTVRESDRIGLSIGDAAALKPDIDRLIPKSYPRDAGNVVVGPTVSVTLEADPSDATVTPSTSIDASTGAKTRLLFTWLVRPQHPSKGMFFTAHIAIPLSDGRSQTSDLPLTLPVRRTTSYTANQVFTTWGTWAAIAAAVGGAFAWLRKRRRKQTATPADSPRRVAPG